MQFWPISFVFWSHSFLNRIWRRTIICSSQISFRKAVFYLVKNLWPFKWTSLRSKESILKRWVRHEVDHREDTAAKFCNLKLFFRHSDVKSCDIKKVFFVNYTLKGQFTNFHHWSWRFVSMRGTEMVMEIRLDERNWNN